MAALVYYRHHVSRTFEYRSHATGIGHFRYMNCIFSALHAMQTRSSDENSVSPSVRTSVSLFVKRVICYKIENRSVQIFIPYERSFSLVF